MPVVYRRPSSVSAIWSRKIGYFVIILLLTVWVGHRFFDLQTSNAVVVGLLASVIAALGLGLAIIGFSMLWLVGARGGRASFVGLCLNLVALLPFGFSLYRYVSLPEQYDVVTSSDVPIEWLRNPSRPRSWLSSDSSGEVILNLNNTRIYGQLTERRYEGAIDRVYRAIRAVASEEKLRVIAREGDDFLSPDEPQLDEGEAAETTSIPVPAPTPRDRINASVQGQLADGADLFEGSTIRLQFAKGSLILGLKHDILVLLTEDETATFVNMRAATKQGPHDLGLNAELINSFLSKVDNRLLGIVGAG
ncbi:MAG: DUF1499 domain-containing protein [Rhizobiaceae bacterium]|nr:DUF1499 domain-containing protein [Rhizobiaceae bacterium]